MSISRRTLLTASASGLSLLGLAACTRTTPVPTTPTATPSATPTPTPTVGAAGLPEPIAFARSDWTGDPFARGSGSFLRPGATAADREALARPVDDRVFFAGEAL
uniref:FAD-dependent oxidoreductase n=1 Tax=Clavibacter sp. MX14-G9D TaxID=3064656 RepID=UPI00293E83F5